MLGQWFPVWIFIDVILWDNRKQNLWSNSWPDGSVLDAIKADQGRIPLPQVLVRYDTLWPSNSCYICEPVECVWPDVVPNLSTARHSEKDSYASKISYGDCIHLLSPDQGFVYIFTIHGAPVRKGNSRDSHGEGTMIKPMSVLKSISYLNVSGCGSIPPKAGVCDRFPTAQYNAFVLWYDRHHVVRRDLNSHRSEQSRHVVLQCLIERSGLCSRIYCRYSLKALRSSWSLTRTQGFVDTSWLYLS